jgi:hypothetical protein
MDLMFSKYKDTFIAAINSTLDMLYNSKDIMELKLSKEPNKPSVDDTKLTEIKNSIATLERVLNTYKTTGAISKEDEKYAVGALGTVIVHLELLADSYKEAAKQAKIIIANIKQSND